LKNKGFKKESITKVGLYAISKSTTLESNKSQPIYKATVGCPANAQPVTWEPLPLCRLVAHARHAIRVTEAMRLRARQGGRDPRPHAKNPHGADGGINGVLYPSLVPMAPEHEAGIASPAWRGL